MDLNLGPKTIVMMVSGVLVFWLILALFSWSESGEPKRLHHIAPNLNIVETPSGGRRSSEGAELEA